MHATDIRLPSPTEMDRNSLRATCADGPAGHRNGARIELSNRLLVLVAVIVSCTTSLFAQTSGCNPPVPHVGCLAQDLEGLPPNIIDPCGAGERPDPGTGMDHVGSNANSRFRFLDRTTLNVGWTMPPASPTAGDTVLILDTSTGSSVSTFVFHVDVTPFAGGEFVLSYRLLNNLDEAGPNDIVAIQDGVTAGNGVLAQNTPSGSPGLDGFKEVLLNDWIVGNHNGGQGPTAIRAWTCFTHTIDAAFYAANGLVPSGDVRILFRQQDNAFFEGNNCLAIDDVRICPQLGQAPDSLLSFFDINSAVTPDCANAGDEERRLLV